VGVFAAFGPGLRCEFSNVLVGHCGQAGQPVAQVGEGIDAGDAAVFNDVIQIEAISRHGPILMDGEFASMAPEDPRMEGLTKEADSCHDPSEGFGLWCQLQADDSSGHSKDKKRIFRQILQE